MGRSGDGDTARDGDDAKTAERKLKERRTLARLREKTPSGTRRASVTAALRALREGSDSDETSGTPVRGETMRDRDGGVDKGDDSDVWFVGNMQGVNVTQFEP